MFDQDCERPFFTFRDALVASPVLAIYNNTHTELHTDASARGLEAVLLQKQEDEKFHPVSYFSRSTSAAAKYHSFELETLAIIYALRRFRVYLKTISF